MKKEIKYIFIMALFLIVVAIITGGVLYFKNKPNNNHEPNQGTIKDNNLTDHNDYLIKTFTLFDKCSSGKEFSTNNNIITIDDLSKDIINYITYNYLNLQGLITTTKNENAKMQHLKFEKKSFASAVKKLFGQNYNYELPESIIINDSQFTHVGDYYEGDIKFSTCFEELYPQFYNYKSFEGENTYNIEYVLYWEKTTVDETPNSLKTFIFASKDGNQETYQKEEIKNNLDKFIKYRFVFKNDGQNYVFDHIELVN